ncbi:putative ribonuclease H-like domain-containing protein, partial [Tanacetum coccineum]
TASFSDATVYAFLSTQPKGSQLVHEDLEQFHDDDLEEMDLKWNMALLSMRARKFYQITGRKIIIDGSNTDGYDKSKVECSSTKTVKIEDTSEKAMMAIDGIGFDWSDMAEEQVKTNMALMAFSDFEVYTDKSCSKSCLKNHEALKKQYDDLLVKLKDTEFKAATYKRGLATLEDQIVIYKKNEILFSKEVVVLKREVGCKEYELGLDEFKEPEFNGYGPRDTGLEPIIDFEKESDNSKENTDDSLEQQQMSDAESSSVESLLKVDKETVIDWKEKFFHPANHKEPVKSKNKEKPVKRTVRYAKIFDHMKLNCPYNREEFQHRKRVVTGNNYNRVDYDYYAKSSYPNTHRNMTPRAVLLKSGLKPVNTDRPVNITYPKPTVHSARPKTYFSNQAQSTVQRPFYKKTVLTNIYYNQQVNTVRPRVVNTVRPRMVNTVRYRVVNTARPYNALVNTVRANRFNAVNVGFGDLPNLMGNPQLNDKGFVDSGCSRHMTGNSAYLSNFKEFDGGNVTFGGGAYGGRISSKGTLKTNNLDFEDVYFLPNESQILLRIPREDNMYSFKIHNIVPKDNLTCLVAKATTDESMLWHRRLGHINFKNINKLVKENLVRGLPLKRFKNDQTCVACLKGKQHKASCKSKLINPITKPLFMLHMDLFGHTFVSSLMHKKYCLVITDDFSRFTWIFFLATKDETSEILKNFIKEIENLVDKKVKIIRSDNGTEFKNKVMDDFCSEKGIRREYSVARNPQQNRVAERRNRTLIEAARTMLADFKLPTTFWAEAVSTVCYVQNRVLIVKPHNKTPYELFRGIKPALSFMKPFGCHDTILNTLDSLGKFDGKSDEGFFVGYSRSSKAFKVYNTRTRKVEENLHIGFLENKPMIEGNGPKWLFDIDYLTQSMNYVPVSIGTTSNESADTSYFDSSTTDDDKGKPKSVDDDPKQVSDGLLNEFDDKEGDS